jgi:hypothetical protein
LARDLLRPVNERIIAKSLTELKIELAVFDLFTSQRQMERSKRAALTDVDS